MVKRKKEIKKQCYHFYSLNKDISLIIYDRKMKFSTDIQNIHLVGNIFLKVHFSRTIADTDVKCCQLSPDSQSEGTVTQILNFSLSFYFMSKNRKHFLNILSVNF